MIQPNNHWLANPILKLCHATGPQHRMTQRTHNADTMHCGNSHSHGPELHAPNAPPAKNKHFPRRRG